MNSTRSYSPARRLDGRRRLLFLVTEDWYFASHRLPLAKAAVAAGYAVSVACRVRDHGGVLASAGCEVIPFEMSRSGMSPIHEWRTWRRLLTLYRERRPDLVHHVALKPVLYGSFAASRAGVPAVVNALAGLGYLAASPTLRARMLWPLVGVGLRRALNRKHSRLIVQNPDDLAALVSAGIIDPARVILIRGAGVALDQFTTVPEPPGTPVVLLPARMLWSKGVGDFVEAARFLKAQGLAVRFVLAGRADPDNPAAVSLAQLEAWSASGTVEWWGHREDMCGVMSQAAVVCLPSKYGEGVPKALLEAAASGRPIVTTDAPGCREVVANEVNGLLVPTGDVGALAQALRRLLEDRALRIRFGAAGRSRAEAEFGDGAVARTTLEVYQQLLEQPA